MDWAMWGPPIGVLTVSLVVGLAVAFGMKGEGQAIDATEELQAKKKQLMEALRELEADKAKLSEEAYRSQKEALVDQASLVLEQLDKGENLSQSPSKSIPKSDILYYISGTIGFFLILAALIVKYSAPRSEGQVMTGGQMSEQAPMASAQEIMAEWARQREERMSNAQTALTANPNDINALNVLTYEALLSQDMQAAMTYMEKVRNQEPQNPDFMVHLAILQLTVGMTDRSEVGFAQALKALPNMPKALLWRGYMYAALGKMDAAKESLDLITGEFSIPEEQYLYESLLSDVERPPAILSGTIQGANDLPKGILFIVAKRAKEGGGPPVAVKRLSEYSFPLDFELGKGDMLMGGVWPEEVWLEVRIDEDGNAMTKGENDINSPMQGPLKQNTTGIEVQLP